ncbi:hypothetical protein [Vibrio sp. 99-8-1]|uniref:hypothetical protein n=1 Tax=Vibrio sp. 99-8-1 TaxID=2607602 RepID=UPI0014939FA7|nr:hypothetical protein [Vibrio sp. 99-8-1]NOI66392.1 hypothetical protein [Vibrio sp. 99-8-1]
MEQVLKMSQLTEKQKRAIALFKENLHLPGGGFHTLIIELCKQYQLPFQAVRKVLKTSQKRVEQKIANDFVHVEQDDLTKENWLMLINQQLELLAKENKPVMESLTTSEEYLLFITSIKTPVEHQEQQGQLEESLASLYQKFVYKPLSAMLHTSTLYWKLKSELDEMTEQQREFFCDYPDYMVAIEHLWQLKAQIKSSL